MSTKTHEFTHPCPHEDCDGEVVLEYEVGRGREDFQLWQEEATCTLGHRITLEEADRLWWEKDVEEYADLMFAKMEEAREAHWSRLKED